MIDPVTHRLRPQDAQDGPQAPGTRPRSTRTHSDAPRAPVAPQAADPGPVGPESPYYLREWRGSALYGCPRCDDFTSRTHAGVDRHIALVHPEPRTLTVEERARRAGIITAKR